MRARRDSDDFGLVLRGMEGLAAQGSGGLNTSEAQVEGMQGLRPERRWGGEGPGTCCNLSRSASPKASPATAARPVWGFNYKHLGFMVQGGGCMVQGSGCRVQGEGCRLQGAGCILDATCRMQGGGWKVDGVPG